MTTVLSSTVALTSAQALVDPVVVLWQASDLEKFPQAYALSLAEHLHADYTSSANPICVDVQQQAHVPSSSLGIGVGVACFIVVCLLACILRVLRQRKHRTITHSNAHLKMEDGEAERKKKRYLNRKWRNEAEVKHSPGELDATLEPREMHAITEARELDSRSTRSYVELGAS